MSNSRQGPIKATRAALGNQATALNLQPVEQDRGVKGAQQSELVIDSRREKHGKGSAGNGHSSQGRSLKVQQKGLALTNRMKRINSNDFQHAKATESGRAPPRHHGHVDPEAANGTGAGSS